MGVGSCVVACVDSSLALYFMVYPINHLVGFLVEGPLVVVASQDLKQPPKFYGVTSDTLTVAV